MSDLLDGLTRHGYPEHYVEVDDVREALRNPTDEQVESLIEAFSQYGNYERAIRAVLAALAGDDK